MIEVSFGELFGLRTAEVDEAAKAQIEAEIIDRYAAQTRARFDYENGVPVVAGSYKGDDLALLLVGLGRSSIPLAPIVVDNAPGQSPVAEIVRQMGAEVVDEPVAGQTSAVRAGLQAAIRRFPSKPILVTDDDVLPQRNWARTMLDRSSFDLEKGGMLFGGVVLEHGPSFASDVLRTMYAFATDIRRKVTHSTPKARGANGLFQPDSEGRIMERFMAEKPDAFPCDLVLRDCVIAAGGEVTSTLDYRAVVCTRGDRFGSVGALTKDLLERGKQRAVLYQDENAPSLSREAINPSLRNS